MERSLSMKCRQSANRTGRFLDLRFIEHLREGVGKVTEPKAQALFETSAEVLTGLVKAFDDYEKKSQAAWRTESITALPKEESTHAPRR